MKRPLATGFAALAAATWVLLVVGALVRAHGAGLACPDWPLCLGEWIPTFDFRVAFEWGHRVLAGSISLGLLALTLAARHAAGLRARFALLWGLLAVQVVFGGLTVLLLLAPWTVTVHLLLGNSFCAALLWTAADLHEQGSPASRAALAANARAAAALLVVLIAGQLVLGGLVSSHSAGLACASFPTCDGRSIAPTLSGLVGVHVLHRLGGFALIGALGWLVWSAGSDPRVGALTRGITRLVLVQIIVGVGNVLLRLPVELTALHSALAAAIFGLGSLLLREVVMARAGERLGSAAPRVLEAR